MRARTAQANQIRGLLSEFGIVVPQGIAHLAREVPELIEDATNELTGSFRLLIQRLLDHLKDLEHQVRELEQQIHACWCTTDLAHPASYGMLRHMKRKATLLFEDRTVYPDGAILEMRIWRLPEPDAERSHGLKYSLFYGRDGRRVIDYDNERGKGGHRHYGSREEPYAFSTAERMVADFLDDVERERSVK